MSARDDYPWLATFSTKRAVRPSDETERDAALDEIDRLRAATHTTSRCRTCGHRCDLTCCDCGPDCAQAEHTETTR